MQFTDIELKAIQQTNSKHYHLSATHSMCMIMENDGAFYEEVNRRRRIDGSITARDLQRVHEKFDFVPDEWALGQIDYEVLASSFNTDIEPTPVNDKVRLALETIKIKGNVATIDFQLSPTDYPKANKIIEALGGKWSRKAGGHVFPEKDPEEVIADYLVTGKIDKPEKLGFFPTPASLAEELVRKMGLAPGDTVLEPEAGVGALAVAAAAVVGMGNVRCYELQARNCDKLRGLGFDTEETDFLKVAPPSDPSEAVTAVLMNPPFEYQRDIEHVEHAFKFLAPGGKFGAIMSQSITFRTNAKTVRFRQFLEEMGATVTANDADAFRASGTLARTVTVTFRKPVDAPMADCNARQAALAAKAAPAPAPATPSARKPATIPVDIRALSQRPQTPAQSAFAF
jgi:predicted RNA methylase